MCHCTIIMLSFVSFSKMRVRKRYCFGIFHRWKKTYLFGHNNRPTNKNRIVVAVFRVIMIIAVVYVSTGMYVCIVLYS